MSIQIRWLIQGAPPHFPHCFNPNWNSLKNFEPILELAIFDWKIGQNENFAKTNGEVGFQLTVSPLGLKES